MGGDDALHALVEAAHGRGLRILLDLACNHISSEHPIFQSAIHEPNSQYRNWFKFDNSEIGYRAFFNVPSMPELDLAHPGAREWMMDIARYWLREFDVDGYRLDYAHGPGTAFWPEFWTACKAIKPDCFCFGEIVDAPEVQRAYAGRLDGCLDFHLGESLRRTFGRGLWAEADLERFLERHYAYFPDHFLLPSFLDSHDMDRFLFIANGDKAALMRAAAFQMRLPQPPIIYYGTEVGLSQIRTVTEGFGLEMSRTPMLWGDAQDRELLGYYRGLIQKRQVALPPY
jgi:glycosidase